MMQTSKILLIILNLSITGWSQSVEGKNYHIIDDMEKSLKTDLLSCWYPVSLDTVYGGFLCDFTYDWQPRGRQNKMVVTQTRHVWTTSEAARFTHEDIYKKYAEHGYRFLKEKMWDQSFGGFYMLRNQQGGPIQGYEDAKTAYGNAFAIYALAAYYKISRDSSALNLTQKTFLWLDEHSRDPEFNGYFNLLNRDGSWTGENFSELHRYIISRPLWKDYNSSIHLLEAFTELYRVWQDSLLYQRLNEMLSIIRDVMIHEKGYLNLFFERDWTPISFRDSSEAVRKTNVYYDHVSFGHDVETAFLMLEASYVLNHEYDTKTLSVAKKLVDHALANGWDDKNGGFYEAGYYFHDSETISIIDNVKTWWVQAEGLNGLLVMAELFPNDEKYLKAFKKQWEYIKKYLIDHENGGWYMEGLDNSPEKQRNPKGFDWKVNYHNMRALMNCIKLLRSGHELFE